MKTKIVEVKTEMLIGFKKEYFINNGVSPKDKKLPIVAPTMPITILTTNL